MKKRKESRLVIIKNGKRIEDLWNIRLEEEIQDDGRTLKLFLESKE